MVGDIEKEGKIEVIKSGERGFSFYDYRVVGRNGFPSHHTDSIKDAQWWLKRCQETWSKKAGNKIIKEK